jgi:vacuolar-type H+-ATPase subunit H
MEEVIRRIIELENKAEQIVHEAREEEKKIQEEASLEVSAIEARLHESSETKISQLKGRTQYESDDRIIRIYEDTAMKMRLMEEQAEEEQVTWENEIFNRIVGR